MRQVGNGCTDGKGKNHLLPHGKGVITMANIPRQSVPYRFDAFCKKVLRHYDRYIKKLCTRKLSCFAERTGKAFWGHAICH